MRLRKVLEKLGVHLPLKRGSGGEGAGADMSVLVVMGGGGIGNSVEATPVVQGIRMLWPPARITLADVPGDLFEGWCITDEIYGRREDVKGREFDHSFFPYPYYNDIGGWRKACNLGRVHEANAGERRFVKPEREYMFDMVRRLGFSGMMPPLYVSVKRPEVEPVRADMRLCLAPGASAEQKWRHKRWGGYGDLVMLLLEKYPQMQICVIGTKEDPFSDEALTDSRVVDMRGRLSLAESAWVLKSADAAVGNDCGPMHIAYAVQTPSIVIFGPTCEVKNAPAGKGVVLSAGVSCRPCQYDRRIEVCADPQCMTQITSEHAADKIESILSKSKRI